MSLPLHSVGRHFRTLTDPRRKHRQRYRLLSIIVIALCAVIANCDDWQKVEVFARERRAWLATFLDLPNRTPSPASTQTSCNAACWVGSKPPAAN
jgi:hypothetical protein